MTVRHSMKRKIMTDASL